MKSLKLNIKSSMGFFAGFLMVLFSLGVVSCKEEIDESNFAISTEDTAADFISKQPRFSLAKEILSAVQLGSDSLASTIYSVLTARGNYTVFLPTNEGVQKYLAGLGYTDWRQMNEEQLELVAMSCVISTEGNPAYETADFSEKGDALPLPALNYRLITTSLDDDANFVINDNATVIEQDHIVSNGVVHVIDGVVSPSLMTLNRQLAAASNMKVFTALLQKTGWADTLEFYKDRDRSYDDPERELRPNDIGIDGGGFNVPEYRNYGFTAFVENDSIYSKFTGIALDVDTATGVLRNADDFVQAMQEKAAEVYKDASSADFKNANNALNRFVAYHILDCKMRFGSLVRHFNEMGYKWGSDALNPQKNIMPTNVWDYYSTVGEYTRMLQISQVGDASDVPGEGADHNVYLNRGSVYDNSNEGDYHEIAAPIRGCKVFPKNGENNVYGDNSSVNGFYFPIDDMLFFSEEWANHLFKTRMRFDISTIMPEHINTGWRGITKGYYPNGFLSNITSRTKETKVLYLRSMGGSWRDYQGDEFIITGRFDFVMKLPRVPKAGTYEIRMGVSCNPLRGMAQIYFGDDKNNLAPIGLPYDMRQLAEEDGANPALPWYKDTEDWDENREHDKMMRNQGYMKGPMYFTLCENTDEREKSVRNQSGRAAIRRIIGPVKMEPNTTYYLGFKSALNKTDSQFFMDYFEFASTMVYNGTTPEDIW